MENLIYLDNAATTFPKPEKVHDAVYNFYRKNGVNPGRTGCDLALNAEQMIQKTRKKYSQFFNKSLYDQGKSKDHNRLIFTMNATMGLNFIINGVVRSERQDHIVTTKLEHNSVIRPVNHKVREGASATFVVPDSEGYIDPMEIKRAINSKTKLVIMNHASNVSGVVQDITSIGKICREHGVVFAVDSAQTAGVLPLDMQESNIDFLCFTGHKGLFAPTGTGGICVADHASLLPTLVGGTGVKSADPYHLEEFPYCMEAGTLNLAGIAGLSAGLDFIQEEGMDHLYAHEMQLFSKLQEGLLKIKGVKIWGTTRIDLAQKRRVATLSASVEGYDASDVGTILDVEYGIQTRTGLHCAPLIHDHYGSAPRGTVRFSVGPFNSEEHIEKTIRAVAEIAADRQ
ncbi:MAG: aminotransferase class V-fold PLP-dependent enzyme [Oligoflexia bacterium]|nr:aminotransferase class V-fold PLP-dependent enzyme [Oligoflexia bacterium]MBF0365737.1 aminotransferase class V-fold PLP-dependent enzyme [Oligoflexia bacterium]